MTGTSTALLTDHYELTMVAAALADGTADRQCVFETFARRLPSGRRYGVVGGTGRVIEAISRFTLRRRRADASSPTVLDARHPGLARELPVHRRRRRLRRG